MNKHHGAALKTALEYYDAWTNRDLERAMSYVSDHVVCDAPSGRLEGIAAYREFIGPFLHILKATQLEAAFGDDEKAVVMYDTETIPVSSAPGAECVTVRDGKIVHSLFIFDRLPFEAARSS